MTNSSHELIDLAKDWVDSRGGAYLAKENQIVFYESITGRKSDYAWVYLSLQEVVRIISATLMSADTSNKLQTNHVITACQELERVFEYGVRSNFEVKPNVFNYYSEANTTLGEQIMESLVRELHSSGLTALLLSSVDKIYNVLTARLKADVSTHERRELTLKHFQANGYEVKTGAYRPLVEGKKQKAVMMPGLKPRDIITVIPAHIEQGIINLIHGALK